MFSLSLFVVSIMGTRGGDLRNLASFTPHHHCYLEARYIPPPSSRSPFCKAQARSPSLQDCCGSWGWGGYGRKCRQAHHGRPCTRSLSRAHVGAGHASDLSVATRGLLSAPLVALITHAQLRGPQVGLWAQVPLAPERGQNRHAHR